MRMRVPGTTARYGEGKGACVSTSGPAISPLYLSLFLPVQGASWHLLPVAERYLEATEPACNIAQPKSAQHAIALYLCAAAVGYYITKHAANTRMAKRPDQLVDTLTSSSSNNFCCSQV